MDVIKKNIVLLLLFFTPFVALSQKSKFPKDTIYIKYEKNGYNKKLLNWEYSGKKGIIFNIKGINNSYIMLFYPYGKRIDTLCTLHLKDYEFSNLKEIREKEIDWVDRKFKGQRYKPYSGGGIKNAAFQTYLVEAISENYFVIYPVIWRNEGVID